MYLKGTPETPFCGFSSAVVQVMKKLGVTFHGVNVLDDPAIFPALKEFSDWPTLPQIYIKGEFVGGCDILREMAATGELQAMLKEKAIPFTAEAA